MANEHDTVSRRDFTTRSLLALLAGATVTISGCGDDEPNSPTPVDEAGAISANHGHAATVTAAHQTAGSQITLDIQGGATHNHQITITSAQLVQIASGSQVMVTSTTANAHQHTVTFN